MEVAETQLARTLATLTEQEFPLSRGSDMRIDVYLQLEDLLRLEDSEASVIELQSHVPSLLAEICFDLEHNTLSDVLHAALRCLSYLMHHHSLINAISNEYLSFFLGELVRLLFSTQDQNTYKLSLWCLTVQNIPAERHKLLPRTVEGLVQAVVNPFKSRAIEVQALKGLHLLLVKYPEQLGVDGAVLSIFVRPVASRLASSEASTRTQARLVLEEVSKHLAKWSKETLEMVQQCAEKYMLPVMKAHMERGRPKDAVYLWRLTLKLLKQRFSCDLGRLNQVLYVPEKCMEDEDAAVRLMAMQAWGDVVNVCHERPDWLFNKAVVNLLAWPIKMSLEQELLLNVMDATFLSWQKIVGVAVGDFNEYCVAQRRAVKAGQPQNVPEWKSWFGELVISPLATLFNKPLYVKNGLSVELEQYIEFAKKMWDPMPLESDKSMSSPSFNESSTTTTLGGSTLDEPGRVKDLSAREAPKDKEQNLTSDQSYNHCCITTESIGVAFLLEDVFCAVQNLIKMSDESRAEHSKTRVNDLMMAIWNGVCERIEAGSTRDGVTSSLGLHLLRMCIDFSFGILRPASEEIIEVEASSVVIASVGFGLEWQLRLLAPLVSGFESPDALQTVLLHPKSQLFSHITQRMEYLKDMYVQCIVVLEKWNGSKAGELHVDFTDRANVTLYLVFNLLFEYAVFVDDINNDRVDEKTSTLISLDAVTKKLLWGVEGCAQEKTPGMKAVVHFGEESIRAAHDLTNYDFQESGKKSMLDELVGVSKSLREHTAESQQNASLLLDLHNSISSSGVAISTSLSDDSDSDDREEKVVQKSEYVVASLDTTTSSPCLLSASPVELSPSSPTDRKTKSTEEKATSAPTTPQKTEVAKQKDSTTSEVNMVPPPVGSQSAPPKLTAVRSQRPIISTPQCIYPDLVGCSEAIVSFYRHFPLGFRPFFSFYKIKTVGDLSALPVEKVRTFGLKDPVSTVRRALDEFNGRKGRMKTITGSPFRQRSGSGSTIPGHQGPKRPFHPENSGVPPLSLDKRAPKRTKRSLALEGDEEDKEDKEGAPSQPKLADRVTFCLQAGDTGETRITRPGEDSQDQLNPFENEDKESLQEKMDTVTLKLLQHLRRSAYYMDKLVAEEENMQSEESLRSSVENVGGVITNYQEAHELVTRLAQKLQIAAETSSDRGLAIKRWEISLNGEKEDVIAQTPHWKVRKGIYGGANVVVYSCRSSPLKLELWSATLDTVQQWTAPCPHPNIVQFLGVVTTPDHVQSDSPPPNECIVMEHLPTSLYDVLHRDNVSLSRWEIALISIQILRGLLSLHRKQQTLGVCLTSKKVMMGGSNGIKLRRFGLELILRSGKAPRQLPSAALKTVYEMAPESRSTVKSSTDCSSVFLPCSLSPSQPSSEVMSATPGSNFLLDNEFTTETQDLFAFGVLLLEMCTKEKPTNELFNRISLSKQIDPVFYDVLQLTLSLGSIASFEAHRKSSMRVTTENLLSILVTNEQQRAVEELRLSSASFPCFLHADRYFVAKEMEQLDVKLKERDRRGEIDLKRLTAVEQELMEEQNNFSILVLQLEQAQRECVLKMEENLRQQTRLDTYEQSNRESDAEITRLVAQIQAQAEQLAELQTSLEKERQKVETLQLARVSDAEEKQGLLFEILKLKEEKRKVTAEKEAVEADCEAIARKVGGEKEVVEDLEGRLIQAIHRWEEEQRIRRRADRQAECTSRQLLRMEEERSRYSNVLQRSPTGKRAPKASLSYVLDLKDKEIKELTHQLQESINGQTLLQTDIARQQAECVELRSERKSLLLQQANTQSELVSLSSQIEEQQRVIAGLHEQLKRANGEIEALKSRINDFEEELERQAKKKADEDKARKLRQCLTPQCDAPRYLVGASGYCKECEERSGQTVSSSVKQQRHRRHRSWDDASLGGAGVRKNSKNTPIMKLVQVLSGGNDDSRVESSDQQQLLEALKQLTLLLKSDESLKDDLPECLVIKSILALMHHQRNSLVLQLECCRCLSVVVFNHDRNRLIVVAEGGMDPVIAAMKNFHLEAKMQETSCVLLTNLAHNCGKNLLL
ncbi:Telomere-associated protein RIF1 [Phytophthora citrophthora]|uniref:Telomere-associated protein RIF1 n=1 Tax=Phytophthora citrophthora TaxID=4793 RepID=A0AAD9LL01_9STRA|nr:Telomere-associated protein RIF1 [Phytophthora citrophthora]